MEDIVFPALFVIQDKLHGDFGLIGPVGVGRLFPVTNHVAGVSVHQDASLAFGWARSRKVVTICWVEGRHQVTVL